MKSKLIYIGLIISLNSILAQTESSSINSSKWFAGLQFRTLNFIQNNNSNTIHFSLENKLNKNFSVSISTGFGTRFLQSSSHVNITSNNDYSTFEKIETQHEPYNSISLEIACKYSPFDWAINPYLIASYGVMYNFSSTESKSITTSTYDKSARLISSIKSEQALPMQGGLSPYLRLGFGLNTKLSEKLFLDTGIQYNGYEGFSGGIGLKLGL